MSVYGSKICFIYIKVDKVRADFKVGDGVIPMVYGKHKCVRIITTGQNIIPMTTYKGVVITVPSKGVVSGVSDKGIITTAASQDIIIPAPDDFIVSGIPIYRVPTIGTVQSIIGFCACGHIILDLRCRLRFWIWCNFSLRFRVGRDFNLWFRLWLRHSIEEE